MVGTLLAQALASFTPIFVSRLRLIVTEPPTLSYDDAAWDGRRYVGAFAVVVKVQNRGFRAGRLSRIEVTPTGVGPIPDVQLISFDREPIGAFQTRPATVKYRLIYDGWPPPGDKFKLDFFDDSGRQPGSVQVEGVAGPP